MATTSSDIIGRAAKALCDSYSEPEHGEGWNTTSESWREAHRDTVRLILRQIREPTLPMIARARSS